MASVTHVPNVANAGPVPAFGAVRSAVSLLRLPLWRENPMGLELAARSGVLTPPACSRAHSPKSILLIPGFMTGDRHLAIMKRWLEQAGHTAERAGIRLNVDCSEAAVERLERRIERFSAAQRERVTLIGQSRGGLFARVLAVRRPDLVESIVTLGAPHSAPMRVHPALWLHGAALSVLGSLGVHGVVRASCISGDCCADFRRDLRAPFPADVSFHSLYSRKDGIVDWRACLDEGSEWVEINSTHCGMGLGPDTYRFLDQMLNQTPSEPKRGNRPGAPRDLRAAA